MPPNVKQIVQQMPKKIAEKQFHLEKTVKLK